VYGSNYPYACGDRTCALQFTDQDSWEEIKKSTFWGYYYVPRQNEAVGVHPWACPDSSLCERIQEAPPAYAEAESSGGRSGMNAEDT
jgi:hypothetical protein